MTRVVLPCLLLLASLASHCAPPPDPQEHRSRPNILLIVADDLGFTDLGSLGSEIRTPHLDRLAEAGTLMTRFYVSPNCSPTRAMLLSGVDAHAAGLGTMAGEADLNQRDQPGYEGYLSDRVVTVAELLSDTGYHTYMAGKWHLGSRDDQGPHRRGFERSFVLLPGGASHFGDATPIVESRDKAPYREHGRPVELPPDFYSTREYTDKLIEYIEADLPDGKPFFAYAAFTAPHWPLQAPADFIDRYRGVYDDGYDALRTRRFAAARRHGIIPAHVQAPTRVPYAKAWDALSAAEKHVEARKMEIYAAMVENLDHHIGRLLAVLKETGVYDNTFILFFSDNGPEGNPLDDLATNRTWIPQRFDNSYDNLGRMNSYVYLGPGWAQATAAPFRLFKTFPTEGGVRAVALARCGFGERGGVEDDPVTVKDVVPTLLELAGVPAPAGTYKGRSVAPPEGVSLLPLLTGRAASVHGRDFRMGWELFGRRAVQHGLWKLVWLYEPYGPARWELFDLAFDPAETRDVSTARPDVFHALRTQWQRYAERNGVVLPTRDMSYAIERER